MCAVSAKHPTATAAALFAAFVTPSSRSNTESVEISVLQFVCHRRFILAKAAAGVLRPTKLAFFERERHVEMIYVHPNDPRPRVRGNASQALRELILWISRAIKQNCVFPKIDFSL
jgi:hypothetical protein